MIRSHELRTANLAGQHRRRPPRRPHPDPEDAQTVMKAVQVFPAHSIYRPFLSIAHVLVFRRWEKCTLALCQGFSGGGSSGASPTTTTIFDASISMRAI